MVILLLLLLVPVVPAFILFKTLPATAFVSGPLAGLNVKFGGAFGGYVAVTIFFTTVAVKAGMVNPTPVWHVRGTLQLESDTGSANVNCVLLPPSKPYKVAIDKSFDFDIPMADRAPFPHFYFTANGYVGERVNIADAGQLGNYKSHMENTTTLVFDEPIVLRKAAAPVKIAAAGGQP
jgi:hypothetical protein